MMKPLPSSMKKTLFAATILFAWAGAPAHLSAQTTGTPAPTIQSDSTPCPPECDQTVCAVIKANEQARRQRIVNANHAPTPPNNLDTLSCLNNLLSNMMSLTPTLPSFNQILNAIAAKACKMAMAEWQSVTSQAIGAAESQLTSASPGASSILGTVNSQLASVGTTTIGVQVGSGSSNLSTAGNALNSYSGSNIGSSLSNAGTNAGNNISNVGTNISNGATNAGNNASNAASSIFGGGSTN